MHTPATVADVVYWGALVLGGIGESVRHGAPAPSVPTGMVPVGSPPEERGGALRLEAGR